VNYEAYITGRENLEGYRGWPIIRECRFRYDNYTCQKCGRKYELQVHHLTYKRFGREELEDLQTLCTRCHNDIHAEEGDKATEKMMLKIRPINKEEWEQRKAASVAYERLVN